MIFQEQYFWNPILSGYHRNMLKLSISISNRLFALALFSSNWSSWHGTISVSYRLVLITYTLSHCSYLPKCYSETSWYGQQTLATKGHYSKWHTSKGHNSAQYNVVLQTTGASAQRRKEVESQENSSSLITAVDIIFHKKSLRAYAYDGNIQI